MLNFTRGDKIHKSLDVGINRRSKEKKDMSGHTALIKAYVALKLEQEKYGKILW